MAVTPPAAGSADPAVQLTTLPGWRQFVAAVPSIPDLLPEQDWLSLEDGKRAAHDEERLEHHSRLVVVQTPVIGRIVTQGGNLIRMNRLAHYGRSGLMVSGPARTGKTTAVTQLGKTAEVMHRHRNPGSRDDIPVIYITVPPAATGKMIATEIARFLGLPVPRRANITDVIESVCGICLDTRVTMIIVDELHNLDMTTRAGAEASDTLKYFSERLPVHFRLFRDRAGPRGPAGRPSRRPGRRPVHPHPDQRVHPRPGMVRPHRRDRGIPAALPPQGRLPRHARGLPAPPHPRHDRQPALAPARRILPGHPRRHREDHPQEPRPDRRRHDRAGTTAPDGAETVTNMLPRDRAELIMAEHAAGQSIREIAASLRPQHSARSATTCSGGAPPASPRPGTTTSRPFAAYCRRRLADDPHLRAAGPAGRDLRPRLPGSTRATFYRALERHEHPAAPVPATATSARISGYVLQPPARQPQPFPLPVPGCPGERGNAGLVPRPPRRRQPDQPRCPARHPPALVPRSRPGGTTTAGSMTSSRPGQTTPPRASPWSAAQPPQPSRTRFPPSAGSAASPSGPSPHAASAQQPAASSSRSRSTFPPTTRSASGTASGCPGREHRSSASAGCPDILDAERRARRLLRRCTIEQLIYSTIQAPAGEADRAWKRRTTALIESNPRPVTESGPQELFQAAAYPDAIAAVCASRKARPEQSLLAEAAAAAISNGHNGHDDSRGLTIRIPLPRSEACIEESSLSRDNGRVGARRSLAAARRGGPRRGAPVTRAPNECYRVMARVTIGRS